MLPSTASMVEDAVSNRSSRHVDRSENVSGLSDVSFSSTLTADSDRLASAPLIAENGTGNGKQHPKGNTGAPAAGPAHGRHDNGRGWKAMDDPKPSTSTSPVIDDPLTLRANGHARLPSADAKGTYVSGVGGGRGLGFSSVLPPTLGSQHRLNANGAGANVSSRNRSGSGAAGADLYNREAAESYLTANDDVAEAKRVQQNLERWAAKERNRRKAARTSRSSLIAPPSAGGSLARRLSGIRSTSRSLATGLGAGPSSERLAEASSVNPRFPRTDLRSFLRGATRPDSLSSIDSSNTQDELIKGSQSGDSGSKSARYLVGSNGNSGGGEARLSSFGGGRSSDPALLEDVPESESESSHDKGKGRAQNPFEDASEEAAEDIYQRQYPSVAPSKKPTPTASRPIVTVGRASSIQRRTIEASIMDRGKGERRMPSIVATDTEASIAGEGEEHPGAGRSANPFASAEDANYPPAGGAGPARGGVSTTLHQGGLDEEVAMELNGRRNQYSMSVSEPYGGARDDDARGDVRVGSMDVKLSNQPSRASTSSSKFRELGITAGDDWMESVEASDRRGARGTQGRQREQGTEMRSWWTDWLCGCRRTDNDEEQAGRTNPME